MKRTIYILAASTALVVAALCLYHFMIRGDIREISFLWLGYLLPNGLVILAYFSLRAIRAENRRNLTGTIVAHQLKKFRYSEHWQDGSWAICVRDKRGRDTWLHFSEEAFGYYPLGSQYPVRKQETRSAVQQNAS